MNLRELLNHPGLAPEVQDRLRAAIDADHDAPALHPTAWQAAMVSRFGAIVGGGAALSCLGLLLSDAMQENALPMAFLCSGAGLALRRNAPPRLGDLLGQVGLLLHWTGALLFGIGLSMFDVRPRTFAVLWMIWESVAIAAWPDFAQRGLSAIGWMVALMVFLTGTEHLEHRVQVVVMLPAVITLALWTAQPALARRGLTEVVEPIGSAWLTLSLCCVLPARAFEVEPVQSAGICAAVLFVAAVARLAARDAMAPLWPALLVLTLAIAPASLIVPGIGTAGALGLTLVSVGRPRLAGAAATTLAANIAFLYYDFDLSFSTKAAVMAATGAALIAASFLVPNLEER